LVLRAVDFLCAALWRRTQSLLPLSRVVAWSGCMVIDALHRVFGSSRGHPHPEKDGHWVAIVPTVFQLELPRLPFPVRGSGALWPARSRVFLSRLFPGSAPFPQPGSLPRRRV